MFVVVVVGLVLCPFVLFCWRCRLQVCVCCWFARVCRCSCCCWCVVVVGLFVCLLFCCLMIWLCVVVVGLLVSLFVFVFVGLRLFGCLRFRLLFVCWSVWLLLLVCSCASSV